MPMRITKGLNPPHEYLVGAKQMREWRAGRAARTIDRKLAAIKEENAAILAWAYARGERIQRERMALRGGVQ